MAYGHGLPHSSPLSISGGLRKRHRPPPPEVPEGVLVKIQKKAGSGPSRAAKNELWCLVQWKLSTGHEGHVLQHPCQSARQALPRYSRERFRCPTCGMHAEDRMRCREPTIAATEEGLGEMGDGKGVSLGPYPKQGKGGALAAVSHRR